MGIKRSVGNALIRKETVVAEVITGATVHARIVHVTSGSTISRDEKPVSAEVSVGKIGELGEYFWKWRYAVINEVVAHVTVDCA